MGINAQWLLLDRLLLAGLVLLLSIFIARALGPDEFGILSFVLSMVALTLPVAKFGLTSLIVKQIATGSTNRFAWVFGGATLSFIMAIVLSLALLTGTFNISGSAEIGVLSAILCVRLVATCFLPFSYAFQSDLKSGWIVFGRSIGILVTLLLTATVFSIGLNLRSAALILVTESTVSGIVFLTSFAWFYRKEKKDWLPGVALVKTIARDAWPLMLAGVALNVYMKADIFMLGLLAPGSEVGLYSVAARISESASLLPSVITVATFPVFIKVLAGSDEAAIDRATQLLFDATIGVALMCSLLLFVFSDFLIVTLFGAEYAPAVTILKIHVFSVCMIAVGLARSRLLIAMGEHRIIMYASAIGAGVNILLNLILIPYFGGKGAAVATVASYSLAAYFACLIFPQSRRAFRHATLALLLPARVIAMAIVLPGKRRL